MPLFVLVMLFKGIWEVIRVRRERDAAKPEPLCVGCLNAHVQYGANARRAISCTYGGTVRRVNLDVLYCTDYETRNAPVRSRTVGFVREIVPAE
jgi:hypothetical protein